MERVQVLKGKLHDDILWEIQKFDAHPTADLIRKLQFTRYRGGLGVRTTQGYFLNKWLELLRRLKCNRTYKQTGQAWQIVDFEIRQMYLVYDLCLFGNPPDLDCLSAWVKKEFLAARPMSPANRRITSVPCTLPLG